jgi:hypothetical protein
MRYRAQRDNLMFLKVFVALVLGFTLLASMMAGAISILDNSPEIDITNSDV